MKEGRGKLCVSEDVDATWDGTVNKKEEKGEGSE